MLYDKLLVLRDPEDKKVGDFILPESSVEKPATGIVVAVGHGRLLDNGTVVPMCVKVGDHIVFAKWAGTDVDYKGKKHILMPESEVFWIDSPVAEKEVETNE